nr:unnamed protein product [Spirometra erinaceieuropaei]
MSPLVFSPSKFSSTSPTLLSSHTVEKSYDEGDVQPRQLEEVGAGYTFFWSGLPNAERQDASVAFAIWNHIVGLHRLLQGINYRLMSLRIFFRRSKSATIIKAFTRPLAGPDDAKVKFYEDIRLLFAPVPKVDKLLGLGDFNASIQTDCAVWRGVLGPHEIAVYDDNGLLILRTCAEYRLLVTNVYVRLPMREEAKWMHPQSRRWHLLDYVLVRRRDQ